MTLKCEMGMLVFLRLFCHGPTKASAAVLSWLMALYMEREAYVPVTGWPALAARVAMEESSTSSAFSSTCFP